MTNFSFIEQKSDLERNVWRFYFGSDCNLYVDSYKIESRETKRKKNWRVDKAYSRTSMDRNFACIRLSADEVPLTEEIKETALKEFMKLITVKMWDKQ